MLCCAHRPVRLVNFYDNYFIKILDICVLKLFLIALDCQYFDLSDPSRQYINKEFDDYSKY